MTAQLLICVAAAFLVGGWLVAPSVRITRSRRAGFAVQFGIPLSLASTTILGSLAYVSGYFVEFPIMLCVGALAFNAWAFFSPWPRSIPRIKIEPRRIGAGLTSGDAMFLAFAFFVGVAAILACFSDSVSHQSPGAPDSWYLWGYRNSISAGNSISYPPGWFSLLAPAAAAGDGIWRFMGPSLGVLTLLGIFLVSRPLLGRYLALVLVALTLLPPMALPLKWASGFWPTGITLLLVVGATVALLGLFARDNGMVLLSGLTAALLGSAAALCNPLPGIQWAVVAAVGVLLACAVGSRWPGKGFRTHEVIGVALPVILVVLLSAYLAPGLVVGGYERPSLPAGVVDGPGSTSSGPGSTSSGASSSPAAQRPDETGSEPARLARSMMTLKFQGLLPGPISLKLGAPALFFFGLFAFGLGWYRRAVALVLLGAIASGFAVILQTGLVTPFMYTGRSAFYCAFLGLLLAGVVARELVPEPALVGGDLWSRVGIGAVVSLSLVSAVFFAPAWERITAPDAAFGLAEEIAGWPDGSKAEVSTNIFGLALVDGLAVKPLSPSSRSASALLIDTKRRESSPPGARHDLFFRGNFAGPDLSGDTDTWKQNVEEFREALRLGWRPIARRDGVVVLVRN